MKRNVRKKITFAEQTPLDINPEKTGDDENEYKNCNITRHRPDCGSGKECFPAAEAATKEEFEQRLSHYADHFWLMFEDDKLIAFVDGMVTDQEDLTDEMYENASMHQEDGAWQMIFGVDTLPAYRNHGYAGELLKRAIADAKDQGRKGLVLTCKDRLVHYYAKFGFENEGVSESMHGNVVWNQMRLKF